MARPWPWRSSITARTCRLLNRNVGRLGAAKNFVNKFRSTSIQCRKIWSNMTLGLLLGKLSKTIDRRQSCAQCQCIDANPIGAHEWIGYNVQRIGPPHQRSRDIISMPDFRDHSHARELPPAPQATPRRRSGFQDWPRSLIAADRAQPPAIARFVCPQSRSVGLTFQ